MCSSHVPRPCLGHVPDLRVAGTATTRGPGAERSGGTVQGGSDECGTRTRAMRVHEATGTTPGMDPREDTHARRASFFRRFIETSHTPLNSDSCPVCIVHIASTQPPPCLSLCFLITKFRELVRKPNSWSFGTAQHVCLSSNFANGWGTGLGHLSFSIAVRASVIVGKTDWLRYTRTLSF